MSADISITIAGVKETLRELSKVEPELRKEIISDFKQIVKPVVDEARGNLPAAPPLSGFARNWKGGAIFPWTTTVVAKSIVAAVDTRRRGNALAVLKVVMKSPAGTVADMAGKRGGTTPRGIQMIAALQERYRQASRFMWPAYDRQSANIEDELVKVVEKVADATSRRLIS